MTEKLIRNENEAIECLKKNKPKSGYYMLQESVDMAIQALEEVQAYRAIGLTPELIEAMQGHNIALINDLGEYQSIGTIEEFKDLKEKSVAKKPTYSDFDENEAEEIIPYKAVCPICGHEFEFGTWNDEENHHCVCGQKLDWQ